MPTPTPSAPPLEDLGESEDDANDAAIAAEAQERGTAAIRAHLSKHLEQNPSSTYVSWIATLHPENATVTIDPRFEIPGNPWMVVYEEAKRDVRQGRMVPQNSDAGVDTPQNNEAPHPAMPALPPHRGILDLSIGLALDVASVGSTAALEIASLVVYGLAVLSHRSVRFCSVPRVTFIKAVPCVISLLLLVIFRLVDFTLLLTSVILVEVLAGSSFLCCSLVALSAEIGSRAHQRNRKLAHLTRWACRQRFQGLEPPRALVPWGGNSKNIAASTDQDEKAEFCLNRDEPDESDEKTVSDETAESSTVVA